MSSEYSPVPGDPCGSEFYEITSEEGYLVYKNSKDLPLVKGKTSKYRCRFTAPTVLEERTFFITGTLEYTYIIDKEISVNINP